MRLPEEYEEHGGLTPVAVMTIVAVTFFVASILVLVLFLNRKSHPQSTASQPSVPQESSPVIQDPGTEVVSGSALKPEDLDFWDMYPVDGEEADAPEAADNSFPDKTDEKPSSVGKTGGKSSYAEKAEQERERADALEEEIRKLKQELQKYQGIA